MKWSVSIRVPDLGAEVDRAVTALVVLLDRLRATDVVDGMVVDRSSGLPIEHCRHVGGVHARPGAKYELSYPGRDVAPVDLGDRPMEIGGRTVAADDPRVAQLRRGLEQGATIAPRTSVVEVIADDAHRVEFSITERGSGTDERRFAIDSPRRPTTASASWRLTDARAGSRTLELEGTCDLAAVGQIGSDGRRPPVRVAAGTGRHPRIQGRGDVTVASAGGAWDVDVEVSARLRGLLRPVGFVISPIVNWGIRRWMRDLARDMTEEIAAVLEPINAAPSAEALADEWMNALLRCRQDETPS